MGKPVFVGCLGRSQYAQWREGDLLPRPNDRCVYWDLYLQRNVDSGHDIFVALASKMDLRRTTPTRNAVGKPAGDGFMLAMASRRADSTVTA